MSHSKAESCSGVVRYTTPSTTTSQTPILYKDMVIETGRGNGVTAFRVAPGSGEWTTTNVWHTDEVSAHMSDAVVIDGVLFGLSHLNSGQYFALDLETGKVLWKSDAASGESRRDRALGQHDLLARGRQRARRHSLQQGALRAGHSLQGRRQRHVDAAGHLRQSNLREGCVVPDALDDQLRFREGLPRAQAHDSQGGERRIAVGQGFEFYERL